MFIFVFTIVFRSVDSQYRIFEAMKANNLFVFVYNRYVLLVRPYYTLRISYECMFDN